MAGGTSVLAAGGRVGRRTSEASGGGERTSENEVWNSVEFGRLYAPRRRFGHKRRPQPVAYIDSPRLKQRRTQEPSIGAKGRHATTTLNAPCEPKSTHLEATRLRAGSSSRSSPRRSSSSYYQTQATAPPPTHDMGRRHKHRTASSVWLARRGPVVVRVSPCCGCCLGRRRRVDRGWAVGGGWTGILVGWTGSAATIIRKWRSRFFTGPTTCT